MPRTSDFLRAFLQNLRSNLADADYEVWFWSWPHPVQESVDFAYILMAASLEVHFARLDDEMTVRDFSRHVQYWYETATIPGHNSLCGLMLACINWHAITRNS